jgi:hypothetical protein
VVFSDALDRETAWLTTADSLGNLNTLFQVIQARWPRTPSKKQYQLYVLRKPAPSAISERNSAQRRELVHHLELRLFWPITSGTGSGESDQLAFDQAIDTVLARVIGPLGDKTHGGRFAWAAEDGPLSVNYADPANSHAEGVYSATVEYLAADFEINI